MTKPNKTADGPPFSLHSNRAAKRKPAQRMRRYRSTLQEKRHRIADDVTAPPRRSIKIVHQGASSPVTPFPLPLHLISSPSHPAAFPTVHMLLFHFHRYIKNSRLPPPPPPLSSPEATCQPRPQCDHGVPQKVAPVGFKPPSPLRFSLSNQQCPRRPTQTTRGGVLSEQETSSPANHLPDDCLSGRNVISNTRLLSSKPVEEEETCDGEDSNERGRAVVVCSPAEECRSLLLRHPPFSLPGTRSNRGWNAPTRGESCGEHLCLRTLGGQDGEMLPTLWRRSEVLSTLSQL